MTFKLAGWICMLATGTLLLLASCRLKRDTRGRNGKGWPQKQWPRVSPTPPYRSPTLLCPKFLNVSKLWLSLLCSQTAGSTFHLVSVLENSLSSCLLHDAPRWHRTNTFRQLHAHTEWVCAWLPACWRLIHKAVIYPIALSLNVFEWDQRNYNLQCLMVKGKMKRK